MADNVDITAGAGVTVHADEYNHGTLGTGITQLVKLVDGTLDSDTPITVDVGVKANALRVCPASNITAATYIGDVLVTDVIPGVAATNLGKAEDAGHTTGDVGVMMLGVRNDSDTELTGTDLDYSPISVDLHGHIIVTGSQDGQTAVDYTHGLHGMGGIILDALPATDTIAGNSEWGVFQMTQYGEMRVKDESANTLLGTIDTDTGNMLTALQLIDNAVDGNYLNVNLNAAGVDLSMNSGVLTAQTLRVTIATDDEVNNLLGTIDTDTGNMVTALEIIDDWDESDRAKVNPIVGQAGVQGAEGGITALTQRVTIATDDDGVVHLNTIAGAVSATHMQCDIVAGTVTTVSTVTNLAQMGGVAITLDEGVHGVGVQRVTIATDDDGVLSLGVIEGWDATHASAASADGPQIMGAGYSAGLPTDIGADGDAARICTDRHGRIVRGLMPQWFNAVFDSANASAEANVIKAGTPSRKIYILSITISVDAEMWVKFQDEDSNALTCKHWFKAGGGKTITYPPEAPLVLDVVNKDLEVITEGAGNIGVEVTGYLAV